MRSTYSLFLSTTSSKSSRANFENSTAYSPASIMVFLSSSVICFETPPGNPQEGITGFPPIILSTFLSLFLTSMTLPPVSNPTLAITPRIFLSPAGACGPTTKSGPPRKKKCSIWSSAWKAQYISSLIFFAAEVGSTFQRSSRALVAAMW
jgi:hypothetical protein